MTQEILTELEQSIVVAGLKNKQFDVLSDGHVMLVDVMGGDQDIVDAARISYGKGTRRANKDAHLIRHLMRGRHTTPFEMVEFKFRVRIPMDAWRQWIRHRTANVNEYSTRYSEAIDVKDKAPYGNWRAQATSNKQGSDGFVNEWPEPDDVQPQYLDQVGVYEMREAKMALDLVRDPEAVNVTPGQYLSMREKAFHTLAADIYDERLAFGVAKEVARKDLPLSTYTEAYWKIDLHNLFHFLSLRMDSHAQKEIRDYAVVMGEEIVAKIVPVAWEAFCDYRLNAMFLTALDLHVIRNLTNTGDIAGHPFNTPYANHEFLTCQHPEWVGKNKCRERDECLAKLQKMGLVE